jgi:hypothetical protein
VRDDERSSHWFFAEVCREKQAMKCCSVYTIRHADLSDVTAFRSEKKLQFMPALAQKSAELIFANGSNSNQVKIKRRAFTVRVRHSSIILAVKNLNKISRYIYKNSIVAH